MSDWVSVADAKEIYKKSETTLRNLVRKLKASRSKYIRIDKSPSGREIIRFKRSFLDSQFNISGDKESDSKAPEIADSDVVTFLMQQIEIKDIQINQKDRQIDHLHELLYKEKDNVKILMLQSGDADASAKENLKASGEKFGKGLPTLAEPIDIKPIETRKEKPQEKPQEVAQDGSAVWMVLFVVIVLGALAWSIIELY